MRLFVAGLAYGVLAAGSAFAQSVVSAHSGVVHYVEGTAYAGTERVDPKFGQFPEIKQDQEFRTEEGRAEILLTPGVFLRVAENSSIRMVSNKLTDTRVEVLSGSAMIECDDIAKDNAVMLLYKGSSMILVKRGLYRIDTNPVRFQVYEGEAIVKGESGQLTLKSGKETSLGSVLMAENFDKKATDDLYLWSNRRAGYLARANASSAMSMRNSGYYGSGYGYGSGFGFLGLGAGSSLNGSWRWNPMFGMYSWLPYSGVGYSPFGYSLFSPGTVYYGYNYGGGSIYGGGVVNRSPVGSAYSASQLGYSTGSARTSVASGIMGGSSAGAGVSSGAGAGAASSGGGRAGGGGASGGASGGRGR
jgi:FecR protein